MYGLRAFPGKIPNGVGTTISVLWYRQQNLNYFRHHLNILKSLITPTPPEKKIGFWSYPH